MKLAQRIKRSTVRRALPIPVRARHAEYSAIFSSDDETARPSERLLDLAVEAIPVARRLRLPHVHERTPAAIDLSNVWPGECYRLLAGLVAVMKPALIVEIGTGSGTSALAMKATLPPASQIVTFDIVDWRHTPDNILREDDFTDGHLVHHADDVTHPSGLAKYQALFEAADLWFIDAAKDGVMEQRLLDGFASLSFRRSPVMVFDDIRVWNMLKIWRGIRQPKLDLTSFGHWTGTGLVDWLSPPPLA